MVRRGADEAAVSPSPGADVGGASAVHREDRELVQRVPILRCKLLRPGIQGRGGRPTALRWRLLHTPFRLDMYMCDFVYVYHT